MSNKFSSSLRLSNIDWTTTLFLVLTPLAAAILIPLQISISGWHWHSLALVILFWSLSSFAVTGGYHRFLAHRSYDAATWVKLFYLFIGAGSFQGSALKWGSDHRRHHRFVDTEKDPYNINEGFWWAHIGWLLFKTPTAEKNDFAPDLLKDKWVALQHKYYVPIAIIAGFGLPTFVGWLMGSAWDGFIYGAVARMVVAHHCTFFINSLCHYVGRQPYSDTHSARDSFLLALFTYGEGYHNYHHEFQADYRNGIRWYQWDPTKWSIGTLALIGGARKLKRVAPETILKARLLQDEKRLEKKGHTSEKLVFLKQKVELTQNHLKHMREEYRKLKKQLSESSHEKFLQLKGDVKLAKLEFKLAHAQWRGYVRVLGRRPALATAAVASPTASHSSSHNPPCLG